MGSLNIHEATGFEYWWGQEIFRFSKMHRQALGPTQPPRQLFQGGKAAGCVNYSPVSSTEVKNEWSFTSSFLVCLCGVDRENFTCFIPLLWCTITLTFTFLRNVSLKLYFTV